MMENANSMNITNGDITQSCNGPKRSLIDIIGAGSRCVWNKKVKGTQMEDFRNVVNTKYSLNLETYWDLHKWSIEYYEKFWEEVWLYFGVISSAPYKEVAKPGKIFVDTDWFSGAKLNYAENLLKYRDDHIAMICTGEEEKGETIITYAELYEEVKLYAAAFRKHGLKSGDRVACFMSNRPEAVFAMLGAVSIGAIWGGPLPFYGVQAAANIIRPMEPVFVFAVDRHLDLQIEYNILQQLPAILNGLQSLKQVIIVPTKQESFSKDITSVEKSIFLQDFLEAGRNSDGSVPDIIFDQFPATYPICINFTSGTTGLPKGLIHSAVTLLPLLRDYGLHCDIRRKDRLLSMYPVGWNLWNLFVSNLALGATVVLYSGSPFLLGNSAYWDVLLKYKVTYSFVNTSNVDQMEKNDSFPRPGSTFEHLRMITIGASPVKLENFDYIYRCVKKDLFIGSRYGATEVIGVFGGFDFNTPSYSGEIQAPALGVNIMCFDEKGNSVVGKRGELVIGTPMPSLLTGMLNDPNNKKLQKLYFSKFQGVWVQSDECYINPKTKGIVVIGRSDDTLNPDGERFGCSDIYNAIHTMNELADYICVGQNNSTGDQRVILFVKLKDGLKLSEDLVKKIKQKINDELFFDCVPEVVLEIKDIPYNMNKKRMQHLVRTIITTNKVPDVPNVRNPDCLKYFCNIPELQGY